MGELKLVDELNKCQNYDIALLTTFNFEIRFFERFIVTALYRNNIKKISLFVDSKELNKALKEITESSIGRKYMVNPIEMNGAFHPKLILLLGQNKAKLFVLSANLTTSGYLINNEIFNTFEYNEEHPENLKIIDSAIKFFIEINEMSFKQDEALFDEVKKLIYYDKPTSNDALFLIHNINKSIIEQVQDIILEAESIDIAVPYYDNNLGALESVHRSFPQAKINLYIQNQKSKFPLKYKDIEAINKIIVFNGFNDRKSASFYHGKVFRFKAKDISYILYGSINCTQSALTKTKQNGNVECATLEKGSIDEFDYFFDNFKLDTEKDLQCETLSYVSENNFNYYYKYGALEVDLTLYLGYINKKDNIKVIFGDTELFYEYRDEILIVTIPPVIASEISDIFKIKIIYDLVKEEVNCWYVNHESLEMNRTKEASDALSRFTFDSSGDNDKYLEDRIAILKEWILSVDDYRKRQQIINTVECATQQFDDESDEDSGIISFVIPPAGSLKQYEKYQIIDSIKTTHIREYFKNLHIDLHERNNGNGITQKSDYQIEIKARAATSREISFSRFVKSRIKEMLDSKFVDLVSFEHYLASLLVFINIFEKYTIKEHVEEMFDENYVVDTKLLLLNKLLDKDFDSENKEIVETTKVITIQSIIENKYLSKNNVDDVDLRNRALLKKLNELFELRQEFEDIVCIAINKINSYAENELSESSIIRYIDELFGYLPQNRLEESIRSDYGKDAEISIIDDCITIRTETDRIGDFMLPKECSLGELKKLYSIKKMPRHVKIEIANHYINPKYGERCFKASGADIRTKVVVIRANAHKYSISALCKCLGIARSTYYYECHGRQDESELEEAVQTAYDENRHVYGQRKLKQVLHRKGWTVSRRRIGRIMKKRGLVSAYTRKKYRVHTAKSNEAEIPNLLARNFNAQVPGACVVSDLTYVRVGASWAYICILLDLGTREIIGYSAGTHKNAELVRKAFSTVRGNLFDIRMFHSDRGSEFDNALIDGLLDSFQISRSLSMKGCPYDNAVAESTFKMIKAEFVCNRRFDTIGQLQLELADYVHWFNNIRLHSTLGYLTPAEYKRCHSS